MKKDREWTMLYKTGAVAALVAALLFRRNIGAEVSLFTGVEAIPKTVDGWFALLQSNPFMGLSFLAVFDVANYILVGLIFLALGAALLQAQKSIPLIATAGGLVGITLNIASNISITMLSLSQRYAAAGSGAEREGLLAAGQSLLATNDPLTGSPGTGGLASLLLIAVAGLLFSLLMLRSQRFGRGTAMVGLLASALDLAYCLTFAFLPALQVIFVAGAGLLWVIWHILIALRLFRLAKEAG